MMFIYLLLLALGYAFGAGVTYKLCRKHPLE